MTRLPASLDELRGRRAALWVRESMAGQYDNFGPDAQRRKYEPDAHQAGAVILFADDWILSSDERAWERWAREAVEAEAYSRRLSQRVAEGYAEKRRRLGIPGGNRAPLGTVRRGREIAIVAEDLDRVRRVYALAAAGHTDREVAAATGLRPTHVAEILTNPFYRGELRTGEPSALGPAKDPTGDALTLARIEREREQAAIRFARDRDLARLEAALAALDAKAALAAESPATSPTAEEVRAYLEDLPRLWRETDADGRRMIAEAVFERIDVLGITEYSIVPTLDAIAHGWDQAFGDTVIAGSIGRNGRGERHSPATNDLPIRIRLSAPVVAGEREGVVA